MTVSVVLGRWEVANGARYARCTTLLHHQETTLKTALLHMTIFEDKLGPCEDEASHDYTAYRHPPHDYR